MASFIWKPAHFEFQGYGGVWDEVQIAFVENYTLILWFLAIIGVKVLGKSAFVNVFCLVQLISCLDRQSKFKMFTLFFQLPYWWTKEVLQHGSSIIGFIILCGSFWWISQLWDNAHFKLGELSSLFMVYNITISWLYALNGFWFYLSVWQCTHSIVNE